MELTLISVEKIQEVLGRNITIEHEHDEIRCCSVADVFWAVERMRKSDNAYDTLRRIRDHESAFYGALANGDLQIASLDAQALQDGLFDQRTQLWESAANRKVTPTHSVRLATLRSFDLRWESDMIEEARRLYGE